jgi:hypothetical protein
MMKKTLVAALMAAAMPALASAQAPVPNVSPAMWVVRDADTTVYLFGTVHALDGKQAWFNDEVKTAFDASKEVVLEAVMPEASEIQAKVMQLAVDKSGKTLTAKLKPETAKLLAAELAKAGAPANALDPLEPWFANIALTGMTLAKLGITPENGVEHALTAAAKKDGKAIGEVEGFDAQMAMFDGMPEELQLEMLATGLEKIAEAPETMAKMTASWSSGDIAGLAAIMNEAFAERPDLYKTLLTDRNARWAEWIDARMKKPGTVFMAVGAGHLGAQGSVQDYLAKKGLKAERVKG